VPSFFRPITLVNPAQSKFSLRSIFSIFQTKKVCSAFLKMQNILIRHNPTITSVCFRPFWDGDWTRRSRSCAWHCESNSSFNIRPKWTKTFLDFFEGGGSIAMVDHRHAARSFNVFYTIFDDFHHVLVVKCWVRLVTGSKVKYLALTLVPTSC